MFHVKKIIFGSIVNRRYLAPAFAFDEPEDGQELFDVYLDEHRDYRGPHRNMLACFEHDRDCFTICFPDIIRGKEISQGGERVVDIRVPYSSIRRLIVTMRNEFNADGISEVKVTFTFQISNPPVIMLNNKNNPTNYAPASGKKLKFGIPTRYLTWNPGLDIINSTKYSNALVVECYDVEVRGFVIGVLVSSEYFSHEHYSIAWIVYERILEMLLNFDFSIVNNLKIFEITIDVLISL